MRGGRRAAVVWWPAQGSELVKFARILRSWKESKVLEDLPGITEIPEVTRRYGE